MAKANPKLLCIVLYALIFAASAAGASDAEVRYEPGEGITIKPLDLYIKPETTLILQGSPDPNGPGKNKKFGVSWIGYLKITKKFADISLLYLELQAGWGDTMQKSLSVFNNINYNAYDIGGNIRLREYYYRRSFFDKQLTVMIGQKNPRDVIDQVKYAMQDDTQFLAYIFNESPSIDWPPSYSPVIHLNVSPDKLDFLEFEYNFMEGDSDWQKIFEGGIHTFQVNVKPAVFFDLDRSRWDGNYRLYSWINTRNHTKFADAESATSTTTKELNYGLGLGVDQMLGEALGVFGRFGWQRPDVAPAYSSANIDLTWSAGAQVDGRRWGRKNDIAAFAVGQVFPSKPWKDSTGGSHGAGEGHVEAYYSYAIAEYIQLSPSFQIIWNPYGISKSSQGDDEPIFVYALRYHVWF